MIYIHQYCVHYLSKAIRYFNTNFQRKIMYCAYSASHFNSLMAIHTATSARPPPPTGYTLLRQTEIYCDRDMSFTSITVMLSYCYGVTMYNVAIDHLCTQYIRRSGVEYRHWWNTTPRRHWFHLALFFATWLYRSLT